MCHSFYLEKRELKMEKYYNRIKKKNEAFSLVLCGGIIGFAVILIVASKAHEFVLILSGMLIGISMIGIVNYFLHTYRHRIGKIIKKNELNPEMIAYDLDRNESRFSRYSEYAAIGDKYALFYNSHDHLVVYDKLVWVYVEKLKENMGPVSSSTYHIHFVDEYKKHNLALIEGGREFAEDILKEIKLLAPWCYYGNEDSFHHMYRNNFEDMVEIVKQKKVVQRGV